MGLFGGGNSKSKSVTTKTTTTNTVGGQDNATVLNNSRLTVVNPDARSIISESNAFLGETFSSALGLVEKTNQQFLEGVTTGAIETEGDKFAKLTPIALAVVVGLLGWKVLK